MCGLSSYYLLIFGANCSCMFVVLIHSSIYCFSGDRVYREEFSSTGSVIIIFLYWFNNHNFLCWFNHHNTPQTPYECNKPARHCSYPNNPNNPVIIILIILKTLITLIILTTLRHAIILTPRVMLSLPKYPRFSRVN